MLRPFNRQRNVLSTSASLEGCPGARDHASRTRSPLYRLNAASLVTRVSRSMIAWAMSMRSNGSRCTGGSVAAVATWSSVISRRAIPDSRIASSNARVPNSKTGPNPAIGFLECLIQSSQALARLTKASLSGSTIVALLYRSSSPGRSSPIQTRANQAGFASTPPLPPLWPYRRERFGGRRFEVGLDFFVGGLPFSPPLVNTLVKAVIASGWKSRMRAQHP